jgi:hypothetical protein
MKCAIGQTSQQFTATSVLSWGFISDLTPFEVKGKSKVVCAFFN